MLANRFGNLGGIEMRRPSGGGNDARNSKRRSQEAPLPSRWTLWREASKCLQGTPPSKAASVGMEEHPPAEDMDLGGSDEGDGPDGPDGVEDLVPPGHACPRCELKEPVPTPCLTGSRIQLRCTL